jgi:hypothetical protein
MSSYDQEPVVMNSQQMESDDSSALMFPALASPKLCGTFSSQADQVQELNDEDDNEDEETEKIDALKWMKQVGIDKKEPMECTYTKRKTS